MLGYYHFQGGQFSRHSSTSESSQLNCLGCPSSSSFDVYVEEACEVVLAASGEEVVGHRNYQDEETNALHNEDMVIMLELSSSEYDRLKKNLPRKLVVFSSFLNAHYFLLL